MSHNTPVQEASAWLGEQFQRYERERGRPLLKPLERLKLSPDQVVAIYELCTQAYDAVFLTGAAGTGKSYVVHLVSELKQLDGWDVYRTASTGVAAQQVKGYTVHHLLGLRSFDVVPLGCVEDPEVCGGFVRRPLLKAVKRSPYASFAKQDAPHLIIIDEVSMLTSEQLVLVYQAAKAARGERPLQFILVGDLRQLGPVQASRVYPEHFHYCFEAAEFTIRSQPLEQRVYGSFFQRGPFAPGEGRAWQFASYALYTPHRQGQDDPQFNEALFYLGRGENLSHPAVAYLRSRVFLPAGGGLRRNCLGEVIEPEVDLREATHLFARNGDRRKGEKNPWYWRDTVGEYNERVCQRLAREGRRSRTYEAEITPGFWSRDELIEFFRPIPPRITLYEGMRFLCRHNYVPGLANGTMTRIVELREREIVVEAIESGLRFNLAMTDLPLPEHPKKLGSFRTCAFGQVGNAMTYWTSQGMTLKRKANARAGEDCLVVHVERRPQPVHGLFYVACSRVQTAAQLFIFADSYEQVDQAIFCDRRVLALMDEAETRMRERTGEPRPHAAVVARVVHSWMRPAGYSFRVQTSHPDYPELIILYGDGGREKVLTPAGREVVVEGELWQACERAIRSGP